MRNITPAADGYVDEETFAVVVKEIEDVLAPIADGRLDLQDGIRMSGEALGALAAVRNVPAEHRAKVVGAALATIAAAFLADLTVVYPEEAPPA